MQSSGVSAVSARASRLRALLMGGALPALLILAGLASGLYGWLSRHGPAGHVYVVFRFDDPSMVSSAAIEREVVGILQRYGAPCTVAVIPEVVVGSVHDSRPQRSLKLSGAKAHMLSAWAREGAIEVAAHGLSHQTNSLHSTAPWSEFVGLPYAEQLRRLVRSRQILEAAIGVPVRAFVPPWNSYDLVTLRAAADAGYTVLSGGRSGPANPACRLHMLPATTSLRAARRAVRAALMAPDGAPAVVVVFHDYDFRESGDPRAFITYSGFRDLVADLASEPRVRFAGLSDVALRLRLDAAHFAERTHHKGFARLAPAHLHDSFLLAGGVFPSPGVASGVAFLVGGGGAVLMGGAWLLVLVAVRRLTSPRCAAPLLVVLLLAATVGISAEAPWRRAAVLCVAIGACVGLSVGLLRPRATLSGGAARRDPDAE
ncbi:MAG TPA: polysaccharide deacetylase family protein [Chthonomonadales bacterium]|nr:polysaccharide deacetylase family protein [Chthonomonadales bacterium]